MTFTIIAYDGKDDKALERRMNARPRHLAFGDELKKENKVLYGVALLDENKNMIGSIYVMNMETREELDLYLEKEPYVQDNVWQDISIYESKVGPSFLK